MSNSSSHSDRNQSAIIKTKLSDEKTIQAIQENPTCSTCLGLRSVRKSRYSFQSFSFLGTIGF